MILRFVVTTKCCSLSLHISLCGGTCAAVRQSAVHRPGPATMALFRSDILNQELFRRAVQASASKRSIRRFAITEKAFTRAFSWLKAATTAFTFKTQFRHYAKWALTPWSLNVKLGPRHNPYEGRAAIRHYANQPARPL